MIRRSSDALPAMVAAITTATAGPVTASAGSATRTARNAVARVGSIPRMTTTITLRIMEAKMADAISALGKAMIARRATEADLRAEVERLRGLLWYAWSEFNAIRARSGAPLSNDGMPLVTEDWWNTMTEAFGAAIGDDAQTPWPSPEARAALSPKTDGGQDG